MHHLGCVRINAGLLGGIGVHCTLHNAQLQEGIVAHCTNCTIAHCTIARRGGCSKIIGEPAFSTQFAAGATQLE